MREKLRALFTERIKGGKPFCIDRVWRDGLRGRIGQIPGAFV